MYQDCLNNNKLFLIKSKKHIKLLTSVNFNPHEGREDGKLS